jgi:DNA polymerase-3 subunit beta
MKITTTAESFLAAMKDMRVEKKTTIPVLTYVKLSGNTLTATDLDMWEVSTFEAKGSGEFLIPYKQAMNVLAGETGPLTIEFTPIKKSKNPKESVDTASVKLTVNGCEFKFDSPSIANFPNVPDAAPTTLTFDGKEFRKLLDRVRFTISHEESRYTLNGALFTTGRDVFRMIGTDGYRMSYTELPMEGAPEFKALIPTCALDYLKSRSNGKVEIGRNEHEATFRTGNVTMIVKLLNGQFPNWEAVLPRESPIKAKVTGNILANLTKVSKCADERSGAVKFEFRTGEESFMSAESIDSGSAKAPLAVVSDGNLTIGLNSGYMMEFLKIAGDAEIEIGLRDSQSAVLFQTDGWKYVAMPMRM